MAYAQLQEVLSGISEQTSWARVPTIEGAYLHTNGTILGIVVHIAMGKFIHGSSAFRSLEIRFRDCYRRVEQIDTSWPEALSYLGEAHEYWMSSWSGLSGHDLSDLVPRFSGESWPAWKAIATVIQHDAYHCGQIALLSSTLSPAAQPPDMEWEEDKRYAVDLPSW